MNENINLVEQPDNIRVSFYGALFAMAASDEVIDKDEAELIYGSLILDELSPESRQTILGYVIQPPDLESCLKDFHVYNVPDEIRYGLMINLVEVVKADDFVDEREKVYIQTAKDRLQISDEQLLEIINFVKEARRIRERGLDDNLASDSMKQAAAGLAGVGIPIAAVYFTGSVVGLSAAGITSGLAALGFGLGMVPGIGTAILIGTVVVLGVTKILDVGGKRKKEAHAVERERKAQLVITNLQETINMVLDQISKLQLAADEAVANREAIENLMQRLKALRQVLISRERELENL